MAQKKNRTAPVRSSVPVVVAPAPTPAVPTDQKRAERTAFERAVVRASKYLGSLQIAVTVLTLFVVAMIIGTIVESGYSAKLAQDLVYTSWWFVLIMTALFVNIFFAAAKKWPWKKHQTGFVITHIGLLMLITGGVINAIGGVDLLMNLMSKKVQNGPPQSSDMAFSVDQSVLQVSWPGRYPTPRDYNFDPGQLLWRDDEYITPKPDRLLNFLSFLAEPLPRSWGVDLDNGARVEVLNYYPYVDGGAFQAVKDKPGAKPAVQFVLTSARAPRPFEAWLSPDGRGGGNYDLGLALVEMIASRPLSPAVVEEFLHPPAPGMFGRMGELVLFWDGKPYRFPVDKCLSGPVPVADGWAMQVKSYVAAPPKEPGKPNGSSFEEALLDPTDPVVRFAMIPPSNSDKPIELSVSAREVDPLGGATSPELRQRLRVWYNPPDYRYGNDVCRGVAQLAAGEDGKLYYRSFHTSGDDGAKPDPNVPAGPLKFEKAGEVKVGASDPLRIWSAMGWKLRVPHYYPEAVANPMPLDEPPGVLTTTVPAGIRCRLTTTKGSTDFWLVKDANGPKAVSVGGDTLYFAFDSKRTKLPFTVKLLRAEQQSDPGTGAAASYSSFIEVTDAKQSREAFITMNEPFKYQGFKLFQTGMQVDQVPSSMKPVNSSTFTVSYDPGLWLKYLGSIFLALGIATMFYMRAYFFKKPARVAPVVAVEGARGNIR